MRRRPSEIAKEKRLEIERATGNFTSRRMENLDIDGKIIKTNYGAMQYTYWDGNGGGYTHIPFRKTDAEVFDELVEKGYNYIKFVYVTTRIKGYHEECFKADKRIIK